MADPISGLNAFTAAFGMISVFGVLFLLFWVGIILLAIAGTVFWILMLLDIVNRKFPKKDDKLLWAVILLFAQVVGAVLYYLIVKSKDKKSKNKKR